MLPHFVNHAPVLNIPIPDESVLPNTQLSYKVPNGTFSDLDVDETLTYKRCSHEWIGIA